ncbi:CcdC protein domain-containing protein [Sphingomonas sp. 28-63-12]|uniref:CcdC protein domain-containing protein n=1 Tax=Sphingomonas sp. 28-63-12 TaxID=1970434 RepID=UPI000BD52A23|nr:MAG: hypothetical protein B7Y47_03275 [Sphingomonas sp. 28-63-12]
MPTAAAGSHQWISYVVTAVIVAFVLALRMRRLSQSRPLKVERLWIFPALYLVLASVMLVEFPPSGLQWGLCALALVVGGALGWQRGKMMHIEVDPDTHMLNQRASAGALIFLVALVAIRFGARGLLGNGGGPLHLNALVLTDMLIVMALGLFTAQRIEMYLRARALLAAVRPARA